MSDVQLDYRGQIAVISLNRPDRLNAYDYAMGSELADAIDEASRAGVIVLTGVGRAFCAGGYLGDLAEPETSEIRTLFYTSLRLFDAIRTSPRPVIAAVNGPAMGGGNELVVACDLAIASEDAVFGQTGPKIGSAPVLGGTNMLAMSIGEKHAKEVSFLCYKYSADEALQRGWINAVVPADKLMEETERWAEDLLQRSARYLEIAKISSNVWWNLCRDNYLSGLGMLTQAIGSADMLEGAQSFMEKRPPNFKEMRRHLDEDEG